MRLVLSVIAISLCACAALAQLPATLPRTVNLPVVGLASSETAQVNVVNLAPSVMAVTTGGSLPSEGSIASCKGGITFYDAAGTLINTPAATTFTIGTGQIFSAALAYSDIAAGDRPSGNGRTAVRATVTLNGTDAGGAPCTLASNIETFDTAAGVTHVHVEGATVGVFPNLLNFAGSSRSQHPR